MIEPTFKQGYEDCMQNLEQRYATEEYIEGYRQGKERKHLRWLSKNLDRLFSEAWHKNLKTIGSLNIYGRKY